MSETGPQAATSEDNMESVGILGSVMTLLFLGIAVGTTWLVFGS